jgi:hypothetical protein
MARPRFSSKWTKRQRFRLNHYLPATDKQRYPPVLSAHNCHAGRGSLIFAVQGYGHSVIAMFLLGLRAINPNHIELETSKKRDGTRPAGNRALIEEAGALADGQHGPRALPGVGP